MKFKIIAYFSILLFLLIQTTLQDDDPNINLINVPDMGSLLANQNKFNFLYYTTSNTCDDQLCSDYLNHYKVTSNPDLSLLRFLAVEEDAVTYENDNNNAFNVLVNNKYVFINKASLTEAETIPTLHGRKIGNDGFAFAINADTSMRTSVYKKKVDNVNPVVKESDYTLYGYKNLENNDGVPLYVVLNDNDYENTCTGDCLTEYPLYELNFTRITFLIDDEQMKILAQIALGKNVDSNDIAINSRLDNNVRKYFFTYKKKPLHYNKNRFSSKNEANIVNGQEVNGKKLYLIKLDGSLNQSNLNGVIQETVEHPQLNRKFVEGIGNVIVDRNGHYLYSVTNYNLNDEPICSTSLICYGDFVIFSVKEEGVVRVNQESGITGLISYYKVREGVFNVLINGNPLYFSLDERENFDNEAPPSKQGLYRENLKFSFVVGINGYINYSKISILKDVNGSLKQSFVKQYGSKFLVDYNYRPLYVSPNDKLMELHCNAECRETWIPYGPENGSDYINSNGILSGQSDAKAIRVKLEVENKLISVASYKTVDDVTKYVYTYNGLPLYNNKNQSTELSEGEEKPYKDIFQGESFGDKTFYLISANGKYNVQTEQNGEALLIEPRDDREIELVLSSIYNKISIVCLALFMLILA